MGGDTRAFLCPARDERFVWDSTLPPRAEFVDANGTLTRWATDKGGWYGYGPNERAINGWDQHFSYGYNAWGTGARAPNWSSSPTPHSYWTLGLIPYIGPPNYYRELRANRVRNAAEMIAIGDSRGDGTLDVYISPHPGGLDWPGNVHDGGANILFCDGHVQSYSQRALVSHSVDDPGTHHIRKLWNNDNLP
jgi:prepilin-type processing-associated H-X9-DG protein